MPRKIRLKRHQPVQQADTREGWADEVKGSDAPGTPDLLEIRRVGPPLAPGAPEPTTCGTCRHFSGDLPQANTGICLSRVRDWSDSVWTTSGGTCRRHDPGAGA